MGPWLCATREPKFKLFIFSLDNFVVSEFTKWAVSLAYQGCLVDNSLVEQGLSCARVLKLLGGLACPGATDQSCLVDSSDIVFFKSHKMTFELHKTIVMFIITGISR